ncbi:MAG: peptidoglycan-binding domain-containing protein [Oscillibacter sp.]|nr:peptidoglycan-binding domain-containing protein [Oscillibacter sp.]
MNLYYGSSGAYVRQLQSALNQFGYGLDVDGGFGPKTLAAVRDYQTKNSLRVDGVVGNETWGSLANNQPAPAAASTSQTSAGVLSGVSQETADALARLEQGAVPSAETETAHAALDSVNAARPRDFVSEESGELRRLYEKIAGRKVFSYDPGKDALFGQYADEYVRQGKQAMADTVGKAASLTGGYASSYGQTAGQEAAPEGRVNNSGKAAAGSGQRGKDAELCGLRQPFQGHGKLSQKRRLRQRRRPVAAVPRPHDGTAAADGGGTVPKVRVSGLRISKSGGGEDPPPAAFDNRPCIGYNQDRTKEVRHGRLLLPTAFYRGKSRL